MWKVKSKTAYTVKNGLKSCTKVNKKNNDIKSGSCTNALLWSSGVSSYWL